MTLKEFQRGGLMSNSSALGSVVPTAKITLPGGKIELKRKRLVWSTDVDHVKQVDPPEFLLDHFVQLWEGDDATILRFAQKWGPLRIDRHGSPLWSNRYRPRNKLPQKFHRSGSEPIAAWRFFSRRAYSVLRIAADLYRGQRGDKDDWRYLSSEAGGNPEDFFGMGNWIIRGMLPSGIPFPDANEIPLPVDWLRNQISGELSSWLNRYEVDLRVVWKETPQIEFSYGSFLLSAVALQMTLAVLREHSVYTCSECGVPYSRGTRKRPKTGDANFCDKCGRTAAVRQAQERRRGKIAKAREMRAAGSSLRQIASGLDTSLETVKRWLGEATTNG
jgi:hypothetical protein